MDKATQYILAPIAPPQSRKDRRSFKFNKMASPQTENGHTKIANEILEQLVKVGLLGSEWSVVFFVIRKTYGWNKKEDRISLTQFEKATKLSRPTVVKTLKNLSIKGILVKTPLLAYQLQKDWEKWVVNSPLLVKYKNTTSKLTLTDASKGTLTHKRKIKKTTKDNIAVAHATADINPIIKIFESINPTINYGNTTQRKALETLIGKVGLEKTINAAKYAMIIQSQKYAPTITTPVQLLNKYGELQAYYAKNQLTHERRIIKL